MEWVEVVDFLFLYPPSVYLLLEEGWVYVFVWLFGLDSRQKQRPKAPAKGLKFAPRAIQHSRPTKTTKTVHQPLPVLKF